MSGSGSVGATRCSRTRPYPISRSFDSMASSVSDRAEIARSRSVVARGGAQAFRATAPMTANEPPRLTASSTAVSTPIRLTPEPSSRSRGQSAVAPAPSDHRRGRRSRRAARVSSGASPPCGCPRASAHREVARQREPGAPPPTPPRQRRLRRSVRGLRVWRFSCSSAPDQNSVAQGRVEGRGAEVSPTWFGRRRRSSRSRSGVAKKLSHIAIVGVGDRAHRGSGSWMNPARTSAHGSSRARATAQWRRASGAAGGWRGGGTRRA